MKRIVFWAWALAYSPLALASGDLPVCLDSHGTAIESPNNDQVLSWKRTTPNNYLDRAFVSGTLVGTYPSNPSHLHLDVLLAQRGNTARANDIEIIYNVEFGQTPANLTPGVEVVACGDYITSNAQNGPYPASPLDAIVHWVHKSVDDSHESGFLMIDGVLYGQQDAPPRKYQSWKDAGGSGLELSPPCRPDQGNCGIH